MGKRYWLRSPACVAALNFNWFVVCEGKRERGNPPILLPPKRWTILSLNNTGCSIDNGQYYQKAIILDLRHCICKMVLVYVLSCNNRLYGLLHVLFSCLIDCFASIANA